MKRSAEARARMSAAQKRRFEDPAERHRAGNGKRGKPLTEEHRQKVSESLKGRDFSSEHRERLSVSGRAREYPVGPEAYRWKGDDASYSAIHHWLVKHHPKTGTCEGCARFVGADGPAGTHHAFKYHGQPYTRNRDDYQELCPACHNAVDKGYGWVFWA